jgi:hypothetical protein
MWGCMKGIFWLFGISFVLLVLIIGGGWWYLGTTSFAGLVAARIEETLQNRLGRDVKIGSVEIVRTRPQKVILHNLRIANAPGGVAPQFATVSRVEITGGIESFWGRRVKVDRVDVIQPKVWFEGFPNGTQKFPHWKSGPRRPRGRDEAPRLVHPQRLRVQPREVGRDRDHVPPALGHGYDLLTRWSRGCSRRTSP